MLSTKTEDGVMVRSNPEIKKFYYTSSINIYKPYSIVLRLVPIFKEWSISYPNAALKYLVTTLLPVKN